MNNELFYKAAYLIQDAKRFDTWEYEGVGRKVTIPDLGVVTLIEIVNDPEWDTISERFGEGPMGYEGEIGLVFKVETPGGSELFLKKKGSKDSYGTDRWDGKIVQVQRTTKTVTVFAEV